MYQGRFSSFQGVCSNWGRKYLCSTRKCSDLVPVTLGTRPLVLVPCCALYFAGDRSLKRRVQMNYERSDEI